MWDNIFSLFSHRIPERSFQYLGSYLPFDARCTGIYSGFLIGFGLQALMGSRRGKSFPPSGILGLNIFFFLLLPLQVFAARLNIIEGNNHLRFMVGLLLGNSLALFLYPAFNYFLRKNSLPHSAVENWKQYAFFLISIFFFFLMSLAGYQTAFFLMGLFSVAGLITLYAAANLTVAALIIEFGNGRGGKRYILELTMITVIMMSLEVFVLKYARGGF